MVSPFLSGRGEFLAGGCGVGSVVLANTVS